VKVEEKTIKTIIHVNQHIIKSNRKNNEDKPVLRDLPSMKKSVIIYTMKKITKAILNVNRIFWNRKLEDKVQDYLNNLLKRMQNYH
jgi:hypothetical protein